MQIASVPAIPGFASAPAIVTALSGAPRALVAPPVAASANASDARIYDLLVRQQPDFDVDGLWRALMWDSEVDLGGSIPGQWKRAHAGGRNVLVPPGARVDYAGGKYLVVPAGWSIDYAATHYRLIPPGGTLDYAGGKQLVAPAGWKVDYAGGTYRLVPPGGKVEYAGGTYRVVPKGWKLQYAGGLRLVVPPGGRVDNHGGTPVVVPGQPLSWVDSWFLDQPQRD